MHIVSYCIGIAIVNGWLFYRRHMNQKGSQKKRRLRLIQFQAQIGDCLIRAGKIVERNGKSGRPSAERNETVPQKARRQCLCQQKKFDRTNLTISPSFQKNSKDAVIERWVFNSQLFQLQYLSMLGEEKKTVSKIFIIELQKNNNKYIRKVT